MNVLVACEMSGRVREAFRARGHNAVSCDILPAIDNSPHHIRGDVLEVLRDTKGDWDLMIAFPPCTYVALSGIHWNNRVPGREEKTLNALDFFTTLWSQPIEKIAIENPVGVIPSRTGVKWTQKIQPWQFGHTESKLTCLWLKNLPELRPTKIMTPPAYQKNGAPRWDNQTPSGQNKLGPSAKRAEIRSMTYPGIAKAMAEQWG